MDVPMLIFWAALSCGCLGLGVLLTCRDRRRASVQHPLLARQHPRTSVSSRPRVCQQCQQPTDDPEAQWCGYCGCSLLARPCRPERTAPQQTETRLVDIRAIEAEIQQQRASSPKRSIQGKEPSPSTRSGRRG